MKKLTTLFLISLSLGLALIANAAEVNLTSTSSSTKSTNISTETVFTRTLSIGSYGKDVMALKKIFGLEFGTTTDSSPTFTSKTASQVKLLQEKYAVEILIPINLSAGTGTVGPATNIKLNQLASKYYINLSDFTLPAIAVASSYKIVFTSTLKLGTTGSEVTLLKIILNSDSDTALNPKNSTNIFDLETVDAVNRFQEKYASEILTPSGLTKGVGQVGPSTRKKLNSIINIILASAGGNSTPKVAVVTQPSKTAYNPNSSGGFIYAAGTTVDNSPAYCTKVNGDLVTTYNNGVGGQYTYVSTSSDSCKAAVYTPPAVSSSKEISNVSFGTSFTTQTGTINASTQAIVVYVPPKYVYRIKTQKEWDDGTSGYTGCTLTFSNEVAPGGHSLFGDNRRESAIYKCPYTSYDLTNITPIITYSGVSYTPTGPQDFSNGNSVQYTITAADGTIKIYTIEATPTICPNYYNDGIPFSGQVLGTEQVSVTGYSDTIVQIGGGWGGTKWATGLTNTVTQNNPVINAYCELPTISGGYLFDDKPTVGSTIIGNVWPTHYSIGSGGGFIGWGQARNGQPFYHVKSILSSSI